eukprot:TRINITY_DN3110_c0_g1_i2.p1 TRINITY_DN3110_c0_g1~~TRINITY_DN3110_c0_g1_i2.p1  ORF type:complete len:382 (+),score=65.51 TRINITY_DN3110_c0_g1_i2:136-1146(+)
MTFIPGSTILAAGCIGDVVLIDVPTQSIVATLEGHQDIVRYISVSCDGLYLATASYDSAVRIWRLASLECVHILEQQHGMLGASFNHDGQTSTLLAICGEGQNLLVWLFLSSPMYMYHELLRISQIANTENWAVDTEIPLGSIVCAVDFHPRLADIVVAAISSGSITICNARKGERIFSAQLHSSRVRSVQFDRSGSCLISGAFDGLAKLARFQEDNKRLSIAEHMVLASTLSREEANAWFSVLDPKAEVAFVSRAAIGDDGRGFLESWSTVTGQMINRVDFPSKGFSVAVPLYLPPPGPLRSFCVSRLSQRLKAGPIDLSRLPEHVAAEVRATRR